VWCPRNLDCILMRREICPPGSGACGPCLPTFQEDTDGRCVQKQISARATPPPSGSKNAGTGDKIAGLMCASSVSLPLVTVCVGVSVYPTRGYG
ncbi:PREDICTED: neural proliferation differentiation and control protein 1, partial [Buceros rhinoceros silvestris]|uniref:neural proliferation differentiation and control protein 1 n=1 Tax=Buceros rhinoceros silvestris TaxID=175836 RepID=UPI000528D856